MGTFLVLLILCYQVSWIHSMSNYYKKEEAEQENRRQLQEEEPAEEADVMLNQNVILQKTQIITESYDADGNLMRRDLEVPNAELVGKNRMELMVYANEYREHAPSEEVKQGLERMVVQSFSSDSVTLVKYYGNPIEEPGYWIAVKDNIVIVYTEDKSEIFEFTNIELWQLPQEVQYDLVDGIYVENERELFDFLQTYSS